MKTALSLCLGVLAFLVAACKEELKEPPANSEFTHSISLIAEYYTGGPQQGRPADGQLDPGTRVKIIESSGSYVLIEAESGEKGYVSADSLQKLEPGRQGAK